tara:strand:+ start:393 stop:617 length:225 start_codon:yes stop_codon:yes gene_type:complete
MINWIKGKLQGIKKVPIISVPKCNRCALRATYNLTTSITNSEEVIEFKLCEPCLEEYNALYNSRWIPPPILKEE